jgi:hypothetical protein
MSAPPTPLEITYIDPDGNVWDLSDRSMQNGYACTGISGIEGLPVAFSTIPLLDGTAVPNLYLPQPGAINLGLLVGRPSSDDEDDYYILLDRVTRAFLSRRMEQPAPGYIQIQRPDGSVRQIAVYVISGLDTPDTQIHYTNYAFTLHTPDPYWSDLASQSLLFSINASPGILPVLPVQLASSAVIGTATIFNGGNALAWPTWTITGPGTPTLQNLTTGRKWSLNTSIPSGNVVQVTTKPGTQMAVNVSTGTNIWDQLVLSSLRDLWSLAGGNNQISIAMAGSSIATKVSLSWVNRWSRALWLYFPLMPGHALHPPRSGGSVLRLHLFRLRQARKRMYWFSTIIRAWCRRGRFSLST